MKNRLPIGKKYLIIISLISFLIIIASAFRRISVQPELKSQTDAFLIIGMVLGFIVWIVVLVDILKSRLDNKLLWIIGMFSFSFPVVILYLISRKNHLIS